MVRYEEKEFKTILNRLKFIDGWFWCRYTLNPYNGCEHACIYCDARSEKYYLQPDFDDTIYLKTKGPALLDHQFKHARKLQPDVVALGGTCDAYQPIEKDKQITRKILEILLKYNFPVGLSTKATLVERDLDILNQIAEKTWCSINFTITSFDKATVDFLEPRAASPDARVATLALIRKKYPRIHAGVNFMPIIPLIEDSDENLTNVIQKSAEAGAEYLLFAPGMTLRDQQANFFLNRLKDHNPTLFETFYNRFGPAKPHDKVWERAIIKKILKLCEKYHLNIRCKRWIPNDFRKLNYEIAEHLLNKAYMNQIQGQAHQKFFWAGQNIQNLPDSILTHYNKGAFAQIKNITPEIMTEIKPFFTRVTSTLDGFLKK